MFGHLGAVAAVMPLSQLRLETEERRPLGLILVYSIRSFYLILSRRFIL